MLDSAQYKIENLISPEDRKRIFELLSLKLFRIAESNASMCGLDVTPIGEECSEGEDYLIHTIKYHRYLASVELSNLLNKYHVPSSPNIPSVTVDMTQDKTIKRDNNIIYYKSALLSFIARVVGSNYDDVVVIDTITYTTEANRDRKKSTSETGIVQPNSDNGTDLNIES